MLKRSLLSAAAVMVMCSPVLAQTGTTYYNNENNMKNMQNQGYQNNQSGTSMTYSRTMRTYDQSDLNNYSDHAMWWIDAFRELNPRDQAVLLMAIRRLPGNEEMALRKAVQRCHTGSESMFSSERMSKYHYMDESTQGSMTTRKFMMSSGDIWDNTMYGLTKYEQANMAWTWEHMQPSERDALMNLLRSCHEHNMMKSSGGY
jgi:hypothetical protein